MKDRVVEMARWTTLIALSMSLGIPARANAAETSTQRQSARGHLELLLESAQQVQLLAKGEILQLYGKCAHFSNQPIIPPDEQTDAFQVVHPTRGDAILFTVTPPAQNPNEHKYYDLDFNVDDQTFPGSYLISIALTEFKPRQSRSRGTLLERIEGTLDCSSNTEHML